jgi:site-specific recombinase XerD
MAAELLREGANIRHIQLQLGHSDLSTTAAYLESIQPLELVEMARSRPAWSEAR